MRNLFKKIMGPSQSLLVLYDHLDGEAGFNFEEQLEEIGEFYTFSKLSEVVLRPEKANAKGRAAIIFSHARKSLFLRAVPLLRGQKIPFTLFLNSDCIGLNRLPELEELELYRQHYPQALASRKVEDLKAEAWNHPDGIDTFLLACRREIGPLPINELDPTLFYTTWGKIIDISPDLLELGIQITTSPSNSKRLEAALKFILQQTQVKPTLAYSDRNLYSAKSELKALGLRAAVDGSHEGYVTSETSEWNLPIWKMKPIVDGSSET